MKNLIITTFSALAITVAFAGCGSGSVDSASGTSSNGTTGSTNQLVIDNGDTTDTTITNEFGLNPTLGTPPPLPAS